MIHQIIDSAGKPTGKQKNVIPVLDLYCKEIVDSNGNERISTFSYEIRTSLNNAHMLKNLLYKISNEDNSNLIFISYVIQSI